MVTQRGSVIHGKVSLSVSTKEEEMLAETIVRVAEPVEDVEFCIFVLEAHQLTIADCQVTRLH